MSNAKPADAAVTIRHAAATDLERIHALLAACALPIAGVDATTVDDFLVAELQGSIIGVVGLEHYGDDVLLRSLAVSPGARGGGLGGMLTDRALNDARASGAVCVYLLTTTAEPFFARRGFARTERASVTGDVLQSVEFRGACPASAAVMVLQL